MTTTQPAMETKAFPVSVKVLESDDHEFTAIVAVYDVVDFNNDVIRYGAVAKAIAAWLGNPAQPMPVLWAHDFNDPASHIGYALDMKELAAGDPLLPEELRPYGGFWIHARLDKEKEDVRARQVFKLLKGGRIREFSLTFKVTRFNRITHEGRTLREILEMQVFEAGPLFRGMNPKTAMIEAKSADIVPTGPSQDEAPEASMDARNRLALLKLKHGL